MFGGVYRRPVASDKRHRPKKSEVVAGLCWWHWWLQSFGSIIPAGTAKESVANRLCEPTSRNKSTNERNIRSIQISLIEVGGGQYKDYLRMVLSYKGDRP